MRRRFYAEGWLVHPSATDEAMRGLSFQARLRLGAINVFLQNARETGPA